MSQALLQSMIEALPAPSLFVDRSERIAAANAPVQRLFGPAMLGRHYITVLRQPNLLDCVEGALTQDRAVTGQYLTSEASRETTYRVTAAPVQGREVSGVLLSFEDISAFRDVMQMRRDFVANVSHELKTPLTALLGFIETLRGAARNDAAAQERFLGIMEREAQRMNRLVQDLLSLSRVEAEERMRPTDRVDLVALLRSLEASLAPVAAEAGNSLHVDVGQVAVRVPGDSDQLLQVFTNLVENAIKYGGDTVRVSITPSDYEPSLRGPAVRVTVADNGEGIDDIHLPRLTERFYRVDSHRSREMGGTGLGLAIVKHIVNRHRGRLRIESERGQGSRFSVILPRA